MLVELTNGGILDISSDTWSYDGCETCDYGSEYVNEYIIKMSKGVLVVTIEQMYDYALTEGFMMTTMLGNIDKIKTMTEREFIEWLKKEVGIELGCEYGYHSDLDINFIYSEV